MTVHPVLSDRRFACRDLKCMAKIASGVLVLRQGQAPGWTTDIDNGFHAWIQQYIPWLTTAELAIQEREAAKYV